MASCQYHQSEALCYLAELYCVHTGTTYLISRASMATTEVAHDILKAACRNSHDQGRPSHALSA